MSGKIQIACVGVLASLGFALPATRADVSGFAGGVGTGTTQYTQNSNDGPGAADIEGNALNILRGNIYYVTSAYYNTAQDISRNFSASYTEALTAPGDRYSSSNPSADGFSFIVQNAGLTADANSLGDEGAAGIGSSFAIGVDDFADILDVTENGTQVSEISLANSGLNLSAVTDPINYNVFYTPASNIATLTAIQGSTVYVDPISLGSDNLETLIGSPTAYVGFTGDSGAYGQYQQITNFSYTATAVPEPTTGLLLGAPLMMGLLRRRSRSSKLATV